MKKAMSLSALTLAAVLMMATPAWAEEVGPGIALAKTENSVQNESLEAEALDPETAVKTETKKDSGKKSKTSYGTVVTEESTQYRKGSSLGEFQIVGYYSDGKTYSGATPTANHTVSADLTVLPLGTKIFIGDTVYTVEDKGSGVKGKMIDIYFDTREEAVGVTWYGREYAEVYTAEKL